jgi:hypothetical protein
MFNTYGMTLTLKAVPHWQPGSLRLRILSGSFDAVATFGGTVA